MKDILIKFRAAPGLLSIQELTEIKDFLSSFLDMFEEYCMFQDHEGVAKNLIKADIEKVNWYVDFNDKGSLDTLNKSC